MRQTVFPALLLVALAGVAGCQQHISSDRAHAKSYVFKAKDDFDPNFSTQISSTIAMMTPVFAQYYQQGKEDRQSGLTRAQALQKADAFKKELGGKAMESHNTFVNRTYVSTLSEKKQRLFLSEAAGAYLDGFDGK